MSRMVKLACVLLLISGCQKGSQNEAELSAHVGVVDMNRAGKELGLSQQVVQIVKEHRESLAAEVLDIKSRLQAQFDAKKKELGENPPQKDKEQLQLFVIQANNAVAGLEGQANARLQEINGSLVQQLRQIFQDQIKKIASDRKMQVVLITSNDVNVPETVVYSSTTVDITNDLIEALKGESAKIKLKAPPVTRSQPAISSGAPAPGTAPQNGTTTGSTPPSVPAPSGTTTGAK